MKAASVRDLRNRFAEVSQWIEDGEAVTITKAGRPFATLTPCKRPTSMRVDWAGRFARRAPLRPLRRLSARQTQAFYDELKGER